MKNRDIIKNAMKEKGIENIKELSRLTGISQNQLYRVTSDNDVSIKLRTASKLNEVLGTDIVGIEKQNNDNSVGYRLYKLRMKNDISAEQLSMMADINISTISTLERNVHLPSQLTIEKLANAFKMEKHELVKELFVDSKNKKEFKIGDKSARERRYTTMDN